MKNKRKTREEKKGLCVNSLNGRDCTFLWSKLARIKQVAFILVDAAALTSQYLYFWDWIWEDDIPDFLYFKFLLCVRETVMSVQTAECNFNGKKEKIAR